MQAILQKNTNHTAVKPAPATASEKGRSLPAIPVLQDKKAGNDTASIVQLRTINGEIRTKKDSGNWILDIRGVSAPPNLSISNGGTVTRGAGSNTRVLYGTDDLMRGHLMKAAWDNNNDMARMTQWNNSVEEVAWTAVEGDAERLAIADSEKATDKNISSLEYQVTTEADSVTRGTDILGAHNGAIPKPWLKETAKNAGNGNNINNYRTELDRMIGTATMYIERTGRVQKYNMAKTEVGKVTSAAHSGVKVGDGPVWS